MDERVRTILMPNVAEAKRRFSDLLGQVADCGETFVISRRGRPVARLVPYAAETARPSRLSEVKGWLGDDDPFFSAIEEIVSGRRRRAPRVLARKGKRSGGGTQWAEKEDLG